MTPHHSEATVVAGQASTAATAGNATAIAAASIAASTHAGPAFAPVMQTRIREFFRAPETAIESLGVIEGAAQKTLQLLDDASGSTQRLNELNRRLVPLIARFRTPGKAGRIMRWFTGDDQVNELGFGEVRDEVQTCAELGLMETGSLRRAAEALQRDHTRVDKDIAEIEAAITLGEAVLSEHCARSRAASGLPADTWQRLSRRVGNLEAMATALRLTQGQYTLAAEHARTVIARFDEIRTLLIPIWYQRMGFELFARRVGEPATTRNSTTS